MPRPAAVAAGTREDDRMLPVSWDTVRLFLHVLAALFLGVLLAG
jgi:hypothetical protein